MDHTSQTTATDIPRISLGSWAFSFGPFADAPWSFDAFCDYTAHAGYDGVEINGFRPHPHDADLTAIEAHALGSAIRDRGLGISGYAPDLGDTPPGLVAESAYLARIASIARFCTAAGIDLVRVDTITPPPGPADRDAAYARLVGTWRGAARLLAAEGIRLVWEYEPGFWLNRPSEIVRLLHDLDGENLTVMFDTSHSHTIAAYGRRQGESPETLDDGAVGLARLLAGRVGALHLIDSDGSLHDDETSSHLPFGTGEVDFAATLAPIADDVLRLPWWTVDYCFWPDTVRDAQVAVPAVTAIRDTLIRERGAHA